jgi:L-cysteine S-thiosulfotransferase
MPPYYRTDRLNRVAPAYRGRPILSAEQVEDIVAFLATLKE